MTIVDGLPTLEQVLTRKTLPPVCLYNFYIVMRDRLHMEEVLDFYLDVQHHEQLWRRYVRSMHRSGLVNEDDLAEGIHSPRLLSRLSNASDEKTASSSVSTIRHPLLRPSQPPPPPGPLTEKSDDHERGGRETAMSGESSQQSTRPPPSRQDLADSSQRILLRYLAPHAAKELTQLPPVMRQALCNELDDSKHTPRDDPLVFAEAKAYLFELMQRQAYPKFLRLKVWGNVTLTHQLICLVLGMFALLAGFTTGLSLIFLDYPPWGIRLWVLLPLWIGVLNILIFLTGLDPLLVLFFNKSETKTFRFNQIQQPRVKRVLWSRSLWLLAASLVIAAILTVIFCAVPSRRL